MACDNAIAIGAIMCLKNDSGDAKAGEWGKTATLTVNLQPGTYQVVCSIPGHVQLGMIIQLTVM